jgi:hypothetical protein
MYLSRKSLVPLALVVGLFGTPALAPAHIAGASGGVAHPLVVQVAADERAIRRRRKNRGAKVRFVLRRAAGAVRGACRRIRAAGQRLQTRRPPHDWFARGPPRSPGL